MGGLDATRDLLGMAQRLDRRRLGGSVGEERLADQLERLRQLGRAAQSEADAQAAQAVDLGERSQQDELRMAAQQRSVASGASSELNSQ